MDLELPSIELDRNGKEESEVVASKSHSVALECNGGQMPQPPKSAAVRQTWNGFVEACTLHGMQYAFSSRSSLVRRVIWALFLLAGIGWFSFQSSKLLRKFFSYPVTTKVTLVYEDEPEFPAVSICNFNMLRSSVVKAQGYDQVLRYASAKSGGYHTTNETMDLSKYDGLNVTEFYFKAGHHIAETLVGCSWSREQSCDSGNFMPVLTSMGLCYTFNSGRFSSDDANIPHIIDLMSVLTSGFLTIFNNYSYYYFILKGSKAFF